MAQVLDLIGRDGIFSTYTVHNISHIDAMLSMLDWLVPEPTLPTLTPADCFSQFSQFIYTIWAWSLQRTSLMVDRPIPSLCPGVTALIRALRGRSTSRVQIAWTPPKGRGFFSKSTSAKGMRRIREWITGRPGIPGGPRLSRSRSGVSKLL